MEDDELVSNPYQTLSDSIDSPPLKRKGSCLGLFFVACVSTVGVIF